MARDQQEMGGQAPPQPSHPPSASPAPPTCSSCIFPSFRKFCPLLQLHIALSMAQDTWNTPQLTAAPVQAPGLNWEQLVEQNSHPASSLHSSQRVQGAQTDPEVPPLLQTYSSTTIWLHKLLTQLLPCCPPCSQGSEPQGTRQVPWNQPRSQGRLWGLHINSCLSQG